jgi:hypothetical protein
MTSRDCFKRIKITGKHFYLPILLAFVGSSVSAQLFYPLIDDGACTSNINPTGYCPTFKSTCGTGWVVANGTPELIPTTGWSCTAPCVQGSEYCDAVNTNAILMAGTGNLGSTQGEGVFKPFYFQSGVTYNICLYYSITPNSPSGGGAGYISLAAENGLTQYGFAFCQSAAPIIPSAQQIGTANSNNTYASFTYTPTSNYSQFLMFATSSEQQQWTAIVTGIDITVEPVCVNPTVSSVSSPNPNQINVTWTAVTGVGQYLFKFVNGSNSTELSYTVPQTIPSGAFPSTITSSFGTFAAGSYTVSVQAIDAACSGGSSAWSGASSPISVASSCLGSPEVENVQVLGSGQADVSWTAISGATSYNVEFLNGYTVVKSFNSTTTTPSSGVTFSGIPGGTYTVAVQAVASCGTGLWSDYYQQVTIYCLSSTEVENVQPLGSGQANVAWTTISGAGSYNIEFVNSAGTAVATFTSTTTGVTFSGIPAGTYTVSVQGSCTSCGTGPWASYYSKVTIY